MAVVVREAGVRTVPQIGHRDLGEDDWHEWWLTHNRARLDRLGRHNPRMWYAGWVQARCNNPDCYAVTYLNIEDLLGLLPPASA
jgi:hypothetical protein